MPIPLLVAAGVGAAQAGIGIAGLLKKDPYKDAQVQAGASAQRLEQSLTSAALSRLSGRVDPATRAQIQRATESQRAETASAQGELTRDFTRRGLTGSGLRDAARQRLARQGRGQRAATQAGIELASLQQAQAMAGQLAATKRAQESELRGLSMQRKAQFIGLIKAGINTASGGIGSSLGGGGAPAGGGAFSPRNATAAEFANRPRAADFTPIRLPGQ